MSDTSAGSPLWWLCRLERRLQLRRPQIERFEDYYDGEHRLAFATSKFKEAFGDLFGAIADNWCALVVDAAVERLAVEGFRFGAQQRADARAWEFWQANQLDARSAIAHTEAVKLSEAYAMVAPGPRAQRNWLLLGRRRPGTPIITVEHPGDVIVEHAPGNPLRRLAGLKRWLDDDGRARANVYLPAGLWKFRGLSRQEISELEVHDPELARTRPLEYAARLWQPLESEAVVRNDAGVVPIVPLVNRPRLRGGGHSDLASVIPLQDAANKLLADLMVASEFGAFMQRWATGIEIPVDEKTGEELPLKQFLSSVARVWAVPDENAKFGAFDATDLSNYVKAIEMVVQHIAAQTRTPPHYLLGQGGNFPSGESLKATETGLVARVRGKQIDFGESWEEVMRLAFLFADDRGRANEVTAETIWRDPESRTEGERVDALVKMRALGIPEEATWEKWGATQTEIARWREMRDREARRGLLTGLDFDPSPGAQNADAELEPAVAE